MRFGSCERESKDLAAANRFLQAGPHGATGRRGARAATRAIAATDATATLLSATDDAVDGCSRNSARGRIAPSGG